MNNQFKCDEIERRIFSRTNFEIREINNQPTVLIGYAAIFNQLSEEIYGFRERIAPGAFATSLGNDVRALFNHDPNLILGRTTSGSLSLLEDSKGLRVEITPPDTQLARDLIISMRRGDIDQMSFGFRTKKDNWEEIDGQTVRTLIDVDLFDVSPVTFPAYPQADIAVRSFESWKKDKNIKIRDYTLQRYRLNLAEIE
jgi:uncharacterized protein